jgi:hypothetical protein
MREAHHHRRALPLAFGAACLLARPSSAETQVETVALTYDVPAGCPDAAAFEREVTAYTSKAQFTQQPATRRHFRVRIRRSGSALQGRLEVSEGDAIAHREVTGAACGEVVSALALAAALTVDPDALGGTSATAVSPAAPPAAATGTTPAAPPAPRPTPASAREAPRFSAGAGFVLMSGMAPNVGYGVALDAGVHFAAQKPFGPRLELYAQHVGSSHDLAEFQLTAAGLRICPVRGPARAAWHVEPCVASDLGVLAARGSDAVDAPQTAEQLWVTSSLLLRLRADLGGPVFARAECGGVVAWRRPQFIASPAAEPVLVHEVPLLGYRVGIVLGVEFP